MFFVTLAVATEIWTMLIVCLCIFLRVVSLFHVCNEYQLDNLYAIPHASNYVEFTAKSFDTTCYEDSCRNTIGHRWMEKSVQLGALWRQVAPPAFTDVGHRLSGIDGWKSRCNLPPSAGKLHLQHLPITEIGWHHTIQTRCLEQVCPNIMKIRREAFWFSPIMNVSQEIARKNMFKFVGLCNLCQVCFQRTIGI